MGTRELFRSAQGPLGLFIEAVPDHRMTLELMRAAAIGFSGMERLQVTATYATAPETATSVAVLKTPLWSHLILKTIISPRQARDKHRKS